MSEFTVQYVRKCPRASEIFHKHLFRVVRNRSFAIHCLSHSSFEEKESHSQRLIKVFTQHAVCAKQEKKGVAAGDGFTVVEFQAQHSVEFQGGLGQPPALLV